MTTTSSYMERNSVVLIVTSILNTWAIYNALFYYPQPANCLNGSLCLLRFWAMLLALSRIWILVLLVKIGYSALILTHCLPYTSSPLQRASSSSLVQRGVSVRCRVAVVVVGWLCKRLEAAARRGRLRTAVILVVDSFLTCLSWSSSGMRIGAWKEPRLIVLWKRVC